MAADEDGKVPVALTNPGFDGGRSIGLLVETARDDFRCHCLWQNFQQGLQAMAIEPRTKQVLGKPFARERGEGIWLEHGDERSDTTRLAVLDGPVEIEARRRRITAITRPPDDE